MILGRMGKRPAYDVTAEDADDKLDKQQVFLVFVIFVWNST